MEGLIILIIALGLFVGIIVWAVKYSKKVNARKGKLYGAFAEKHGLQHNSNKYMLNVLNTVEGTWKDYPFKVYEQIVGSGKNKTVMTYAVIGNLPFDYDFKIGKEHLFSKAGKALGLRDIEFGDAEFDKKFLIKAKDEEKFRAFFNYKLQDELKQIKDDLRSSIRMNDGTLTYANYGPLANEKAFTSFEKIVGFMFALVEEADNRR